MTYEELIERKQSSGFTLAEVILAIGIVGVTAALMIPSMISKKDRREWITALNKSYSILSEGFKQSELLNGKASSWTAENFLTNFIKGFRVLEECDEDECAADVQYLNGMSQTYPSTAKSYVLADGQVMTVNATSIGCQDTSGPMTNICGTIYVDVNGKKNPNTWGKDYFGFYITADGLVPFGALKMDMPRDGYSWVSKACNDGNTACTWNFSCANRDSDQEVCNTCGGTFTAAYYSPDTYKLIPDTYKVDYYSPDTYKNIPNTYKVDYYSPDTYKNIPNSYKFSRYDVNSYKLIPNSYKFARYDVNSYKLIPDTYTVLGYSVASYKAVYRADYHPEYITGYNRHGGYYHCGWRWYSVYYTANWAAAYTSYSVSGYTANSYRTDYKVNVPAHYSPDTYKATYTVDVPAYYTPDTYKATYTVDVPSYYTVDTYKTVYKVDVPSYYTVDTYKTVYKVDVPAYYVIDTYKLNNSYCSDNATKTSVCLAFKYTNEWDCWYDDKAKSTVQDECNEQGTASKASCNGVIKEIDALADCNLDDEGKSCTAWTLLNGNMIYLDGKEVTW